MTEFIDNFLPLETSEEEFPADGDLAQPDFDGSDEADAAPEEG